MRRGIKAGLLLAACSGFSIGSSALAKSDYLDSVLGAVETSNGQAYLYLTKGTFRAERAGTQLTLEIPGKMRSEFRYTLVQRTMENALWAFPTPVFLTVKKAGICVRLEVRKIRFENGLPAVGGSDWTIKSLGGLCNEAEAILSLDDVIQINPDTVSLFKGAVFRTAADVKQCVDVKCSSFQSGSLVSRAVFFGVPGPGQPTPAFRVTFSAGSTILLPGQGYIKLGQGSEAVFQTLDYDIGADIGDGVLGLFNVTADDGVLSGGNTLLHLSAGSQVKAEQVAMRRQGPDFYLDRGSVSGRLGTDSTIALGIIDGKPSQITLLSADATLTGIQLVSTLQKRELTIARGSFNTQVKSADLWFTSATNLRLGYTNLSFVLGCEAGSPATCVGAKWSNQGMEARGQISAFATRIDGGQFPLSDAGSTRIAPGGKIEADILHIDSTRPVAPVTGKVKAIDLTFEGENLLFDKTTKLRAASVNLSSDDLTFVAGEALPAGKLRVRGTVDQVEAAGIGQVALTSGSADITLERSAGDQPRISQGAVTANISARLEGSNAADGTVEVKNVNYYMGAGHADVKLTINKASYTYNTPSDRQESGGDLAKVKADIKSVPVTVGLREPFIVGPVALDSFHSKWAFTETKDIPLKMFVSIPNQELVYAPVEGPAGTLCAPKVILDGQRTNLDAKIDFAATSQARRLGVHDANLAEGVKAHAEDRNCKYVAGLICGLVGSLGGPLGSAALGILCAVKIEDAESELGDKVRDKSIEYVQGFRYDFSN